MPLRNKSTIASGMLAPSGLAGDIPDPSVQATTRPAGVLLRPSPGFDSVRVGRNRFQGRGPSGGFRRMEFAEDIGGSGAVLSVVPGETSLIEASEWLPESEDTLPAGSVIIADREHNPGAAMAPHEGYHTLPDMGDRHPSRPLSRAWFARFNPVTLLREEYRESPAIAVLTGIGFVYVVYAIAGEFESAYRSNRRGGPVSEATSVPASGAQAGGNVAADTVDKIGEAGDKAVAKIEQAADKAVDAIESAGKTVTGG